MKLNKWFFIYLSFIALIFFFGFYAIGGATLVGNDALAKTTALSPLAFSLFLASFLLLSGGLIFLISFKKVYKPSLPLIVGLSILFITNMISILIFKNGSTFGVTLLSGKVDTFNFSLEAYDRFVDITQFLCVLIISFLILDIIPKIFDFKVIYYFSLLAIIVVLVCIIGSFFLDNYVGFLTHFGQEDMYQYTASSFFAYRNSYGFVVFLGIVTSLFMHFMNKKWYWFLLTGFFYLALCFTMCKTAMVLGLVLVLAYLIIRFFFSYKENKKRNLIALASVGGTTLLGIVALIIFSILNQDLFTSLGDLETLKYRFVIWRNVIDLLNQTSWFIGTGFHLFGNILFIFNTSDGETYHHNDTPFAHNGILELIGNGGIVLLVAFVLIVIWILRKYIKHYEEHKSFVIFELVLIFVAFIYMMLESGTFVLPFTLDYSYLSVLICVPALMLDKKKDTSIA